MSLKKNVIANYMGQGWTALMGLAFIPLYIRYVGIEAYGLIGLFAVLQAWLGLLDMGMTPTLGREMARFTGGGHSNESIRDLLRSIEIVAMTVALVLGLGIWLASAWLAENWLRAESLPVSAVAQGFALMGAVTALRFFGNVYSSAVVGLQRQVLSNAINAAMATLRGFGAVGILIWVSPTIEAFFLWQGLVSVLTLIAMASVTYRILPRGARSGRFSYAALRDVWRFAGGMLGITLLSLLLTQVDKVLLSKLLTLADYGRYTLAATVAGALYMLITPIATAWFPKLCELYAKGDQAGLARTFHQGAQLVTVVAGSAAIVVMLFAETLLQLWTRDAALAASAAPLVSVLILGNLLNGLMWIPYQAQLAHGWTRLAVRVNCVAVVLIVPAILWAVPRWGAIGAAWVWVSLNAAYVLIAAQFMYRRILIPEKWRWYMVDIIIPLMLSLLGTFMVKASFDDVGIGEMQSFLALMLASSFTLVSSCLSISQVRAILVRISLSLFRKGIFF